MPKWDQFNQSFSIDTRKCFEIKRHYSSDRYKRAGVSKPSYAKRKQISHLKGRVFVIPFGWRRYNISFIHLNTLNIYQDSKRIPTVWQWDNPSSREREREPNRSSFSIPHKSYPKEDFKYASPRFYTYIFYFFSLAGDANLYENPTSYITLIRGY